MAIVGIASRTEAAKQQIHENNLALIRKSMKGVESLEGVNGFALVAWTVEGGSYSFLIPGDMPYPSLIPEWVKLCVEECADTGDREGLDGL